MVSNERVLEIVEQILGTDNRREIALNAPELSEVSDRIHKATVRRTLSLSGITVDFPKTGNVIVLNRIGGASNVSASTGTVSVKAEAKKQPVKKKKQTQRHQHTYVAPAISKDIMTALLDDASHVIWFKGPTGTGKTVLAQHLANELDMELYQLNCHERMDDSSFFGEKVIEIDEASQQNHITFQEGIVTQAMQAGLDENGDEVGKPGLLFIDEAGAMPASVAIALNRLLESDNPKRTIVLERDGGRVVRSHRKFRIILAANTAGRGATDMSSAMYTAQMDALDISLLNRVALTFNFGYNRKVEKSIAMEKIGNDKVVQQVLKFRDAVRDNLRAGKLSTPFSTRAIVQIADAYRLYGDLAKAMYYTTFEMLLPEEQVVYNELAVAQLNTDILNEFAQDSEMDYM
jgi:MoxR-like ATPase